MALTAPAAPPIGASTDTSRRRLPALLRDHRGPLARLMFPMPVLLYRLGLGWLLGHEFLLLTHVGRRNGRIHETVLKVLHYDPTTRESVVVSAWGERTDWYRNIQVRPALAIRTGGDWFVPEQRAVPPDEAFAALEDWTRRQPRFAKVMLSQIGQSFEGPEAERRALAARFPFVAFRPGDGGRGEAPTA